MLAGYPDPDQMPLRRYLPAVFAAITDGMTFQAIAKVEEALSGPWLRDRERWGTRTDPSATPAARAMMEGARAAPRPARPQE